VPGQPPGFSLIDLGVHLSCDLLKFAAATAAGIGAGVAVAVMVGTAPVVAVFAVAVAVGVGVGMVLDHLDNRFGLSEELSKLCREWFWNNETAQSLYRHGEDWLHHGEDYMQGEIKLIRSHF
jgi:hypothetical protein